MNCKKCGKERPTRMFDCDCTRAGSGPPVLENMCFEGCQLTVPKGTTFKNCTLNFTGIRWIDEDGSEYELKIEG